MTDGLRPGSLAAPAVVEGEEPHSVSLEWTAPNEDGGSPIDSYHLDMAFLGPRQDDVGTDSEGASFDCASHCFSVHYLVNVRYVG